MAPFGVLVPPCFILTRPLPASSPSLHLLPHAPHLVGHQSCSFFLSLKIEGENVIPEETGKEGSEPR